MISLPVVDYELLADGSIAEAKKLLQASRSTGMFYLDLRGPRTNAVFEDVPAVLRSASEFFDLPLESQEKQESLCEGIERGYHAGVGFQYYEIPRSDLQLGAWKLPATLQPQAGSIAHLIETFNDVLHTILEKLCCTLEIQIPELQDDLTTPNDTALKLLFKPPIHDAGSVIHPAHTDFGLATLLWYDEVTTQLPVIDTNGNRTGVWESVPVREGSVLVNIADDFASRSGSILNSPLHRVAAPPGVKRPRTGVIYLLRPFRV